MEIQKIMQYGLVVGAAIILLLCAASSAQELSFERLGEPCLRPGGSIAFVTSSPDGGYIAWRAHEGPLKLAVVGIHVETGKSVWYDVKKYGSSHIQMAKGRDGNLYVYAGNPSHFLRYNVTSGEFEDLGVPADPAHYYLGSAVGPDGKFYIGTYPGTDLVSIDTNTGKIEALGRMADDERNCYIIHPAVSDANVVYCPVGLHHREIWAYDRNTDTKKQILPQDLMDASGAPKVFLAEDGNVYGSSGSVKFLCKPDGIEVVQSVPVAREIERDRDAGGREARFIDENGKLWLADNETEELTDIQTDYTGKALKIYTVGCERNGKIYGGTFSPAHTFSYDIATGEFEDLGRISRGATQVYDIFSHDNGLYHSSYGGAYLDLFAPEKPIEEGVNPVGYERATDQERPLQWSEGPDGKLYIGTMPIKGHLGGALVRVDPSDNSTKWWRNIIPNQSIMYCTPSEATGEMFCVSSVEGGTSAIPTEEEAYAFLWDCQNETIAWQGQPGGIHRRYGRAVAARNGIIYGIADSMYYAFAPVKREVIFEGELPVSGAHFPVLSDHPVGPDGLIIGLFGDAVVAIDPADHSARVLGRHKSVAGTLGFYVTEAGVLYYGSGATLWRCKLIP